MLGEVNGEGRLNLGNALFKQGNPDMAFSQYKEALNLDPGMEAAYVVWGNALTLQGKLDEAVQLYQDALHHSSNFAQVHYSFAMALERQQQTALATQHAAELAYQHHAAAKSAGEAHLYASDAVKHYAAAERLGMNTPDFWFNYWCAAQQAEANSPKPKIA